MTPCRDIMQYGFFYCFFMSKNGGLHFYPMLYNMINPSKKVMQGCKNTNAAGGMEWVCAYIREVTEQLRYILRKDESEW